jgi:hypothetical protein
MLNKKVNSSSKTSKCKSTRETRFNHEVQIHKGSYILVEGFIKDRVSLNSFLTQVCHKDVLEMLTITKMGNTNFPMLTTQSSSLREISNHLGVKLQE